MYAKEGKKTLADHLFDVMRESGITTINYGMIEELEEVQQRANAKLYNSNYTFNRLRLNYIIHRVMATKRGQELFEDHGYIHYNGIINRPCRVIKIKDKHL